MIWEITDKCVAVFIAVFVSFQSRYFLAALYSYH